jgi:peroxiredoxin (alkyl hydroperoxide reductase subunit C)
MEEIQLGAQAPDFELPCVTGEETGAFKLSDGRGQKNVVLAFYALDWTSACASELPALEAAQARFAQHDAQVVGVSVDSIPSHTAWQKYVLGKLSFPLCSDFYPHGEVIDRYGLLRESPPFPGISNRAVVIVDKEGKVRWKKVYDLAKVPDVSEILAALQELH